MRTFTLPAFVVALVASGCGSPDVCDHDVAVEKNSQIRTAACVPASAPKTTATFSSTACKADESGCSASDRNTLNDYLNCVDNVAAPKCTAGAASGSTTDKANQTALEAYQAAWVACSGSTNLTSISAACQAAFTAKSTR